MTLLETVAVALLVKVLVVVAVVWLGAWARTERLWAVASVAAATFLCSQPAFLVLAASIGSGQNTLETTLCELGLVLFEAGLLCTLVPLPRARAVAAVLLANVTLFGVSVIIA